MEEWRSSPLPLFQYSIIPFFADGSGKGKGSTVGPEPFAL